MKKSYIAGFFVLFVAATATGYTLSASESGPVSAAEDDQNLAITVYKSPNCGCCADWVEHLEKNNFDAEVIDTNEINSVKVEYDLPREMASCHTAIIDGKVVEGHVPAEDIKAYLGNADHPLGGTSIGISVPGMPHGTPGMETGRQDDYEVVAFSADGQTEVVQQYSF